MSRALKTEEILGGVALLIFGPAALTVYLLRARHVWVSVDQLRGIVVSGRRVIPWDDVRGVERKPPAFRGSTGPAEVPPFSAVDLPAGAGCAGEGRFSCATCGTPTTSCARSSCASR